MEKFLLASTALVASTTFAFAEVNVSGEAEMGVFGGDAEVFGVDADTDLQFHTDIDVIFTMAGETDTGLVFGAEVELSDDIGDGNDAADNDAEHGGVVIFVDGAYGRLTMGDTDGALDWALEEAIIGDSIADDHEHAGYNGNAALDGTYDGQIARYEYAFGDFAVAASAEIYDGGDDDFDGDPVLGVGARYSGEFGSTAFGAGIGYQTFSSSDDVLDVEVDGDAFGLSASAKMDNGLQAIVNYSNYEFETYDGDDFFDVDIAADNLDVDHFGVAVGYEFGAFLVAANYGRYELEDNDGNEGDIDGYGLIVNYDLGGGAELQAGYGHSNGDFGDDDDDQVEADTYSFGIAMSF